MDGPLNDQVGPKKRKDNQISPDNDFDIVPFPRRQFYKIADEENRDGRDKETYAGRYLVIGSLVSFPCLPRCHRKACNKNKNGKVADNPQAEISELPGFYRDENDQSQSERKRASRKFPARAIERFPGAQDGDADKEQN